MFRSQEIVVNACYGGLSLSLEASQLLTERGFPFAPTKASDSATYAGQDSLEIRTARFFIEIESQDGREFVRCYGDAS